MESTLSPEAAEEVEKRAADRLTFFADAVIAIAITLLALDLWEPVGDSNHKLLQSLSDHRSSYIGFLISFYVIGSYWRNHHHLFRYVDRLGGRLTTFTLSWLCTLVIMPFATRVLTEDGSFQFRFVVYASVQALSGILFMLMITQVQRYKLYLPGTPREIFHNAYIGSGTLAIAFLVSIPVSFLAQWAYVCWILIPIVSGIARRRFRAAETRAERAAMED